MKTFKDNKEKSWDVSINVGCIKRIKELAGVDLIAESGKDKDNIFIRISSDPVLLCDIIYAICKPQADERQISDEQFGEAMGGDALDSATECFVEELINFFPKAKREMLRKMTEKMKDLEARGMDYVTERLNSPELEKKMLETIQEKL